MSTGEPLASAEDRLLYESRMRTRIAGVSIAAGVLLLVAALLQLAGPHSNVNELTIGLITEHKRFPLDLISNVIEAGGWACLAVTLNFLLESARARNPLLNRWFSWIAVGGCVLIAVSGIASAIAISIKAHQFVTTGNQTYAQANHLTSGAELVSLSYANLFGLLLTAVGFVLVALNAMRVGLLTRFMGYLGIFAGILVLFVVTPVPIVQTYWLVALGYLISGRWPTGLPPAWLTGRKEAWPSSQQMREQRIKAQGGRSSGWGRRGPAAAPKPVTAEGPSGGTRSSNQKRKRKRRK